MPQNQKSQDSQGQRPRDPRDARRRLDEQQQQANQKPESGQRSPRDPADRMHGAKPEDSESENPTRDDNVPPWVANLPPQLRDAFQESDWRKVPARYRELLERYNRWLLKQKHGGGR